MAVANQSRLMMPGFILNNFSEHGWDYIFIMNKLWPNPPQKIKDTSFFIFYSCIRLFYIFGFHTSLPIKCCLSVQQITESQLNVWLVLKGESNNKYSWYIFVMCIVWKLLWPSFPKLVLKKPIACLCSSSLPSIIQFTLMTGAKREVKWRQTKSNRSALGGGCDGWIGWQKDWTLTLLFKSQWKTWTAFVSLKHTGTLVNHSSVRFIFTTHLG